MVVSAACAALSLALSACGTGGYVSMGSQGAGKQLFADRCGGCHTLADAGTAGTVGPDLDDAFAQAREAGMTSETFTQVVAEQIRIPVQTPSTGVPGMPGADETLPACDDVPSGDFCVPDQGQAIDDVATYVGAVSCQPDSQGTCTAGGGTPTEQPKPTDGKSIFAGPPASCGGCHTLADAGTSGTTGPNLDDSKPSKDLVVDRVTNGKNLMPSFKDSLDAAQIQAVAEYVSSAAGR